MAAIAVEEHGPTWHHEFDRVVDPLLEKLADQIRLRNEAYAQLVLLASKYPKLNENPNFRAARLALCPTPTELQ